MLSVNLRRLRLAAKILPERPLEDDRPEDRYMTISEAWDEKPDRAAEIIDDVTEGYQYDVSAIIFTSKHPAAIALRNRIISKVEAL
jgi:hypothetical protein